MRRNLPSALFRPFVPIGALLLLSSLGTPAFGENGQIGCCVFFPAADQRECVDGIRESVCKAKTPGEEAFSCNKVCNDQKQCVEGTGGEVTIYICVVDKTGKPLKPTVTCETDDKCPKDSTCKPVKFSKPSPLGDFPCGCDVCESTKPSCVLAATRPGPPAQIDVRVQDQGSGLLFVDVVVAQNADVEIPSFEIGTLDPLTVTATKRDPNLAARIELQVMDLAANVTRCDPVLTEVVRGTGRPTIQTFSGLAQSEDTVDVHNGDPGLRALEIVVNGVRFQAAGLRDGETRTIDVSRALLPGNNLFTLRSHGKPGTSATVLISEGNE